MSGPAIRSLQELISATAPFTAEDRSRSWFALWSTILLTVVVLAIAGAPVFMPLRILSSFFASLLFMRLFVIYHDFEHGAILRGSKIAKPLLSFFGWFILSPPSIWNRLHNYHHSHNCQFATSGIGSFPVMSVAEYYAAPLATRLRYRFVRSPLMILFSYFAIFLLGFGAKPIHDESRRHWDSALSLILHISLVAVYARMGWVTLLLGLILPLMCAHAIGSYLFYAQHNFPAVRLRPREEWDYVYAAIYSSSFMDWNRFFHWFTANIGYHHVHHLNARIPFYRLPEAAAAIPELRETARTSLHLREIRACLRLKLWDSQTAQMVGYS